METFDLHQLLADRLGTSRRIAKRALFLLCHSYEEADLPGWIRARIDANLSLTETPLELKHEHDLDAVAHKVRPYVARAATAFVYFVTCRDLTDEESEEVVSPYSVKEHPLKYVAYDDDGNAVASGTFVDEEVDGVPVWYLALSYHANDVGATTLRVYDRSTGKFKEVLP